MAGKRGKTPPDEMLMPDSSSTEAERPSQRWFTLNTFLGCILLLLAINEANYRLIRPTQRIELGARAASLRFEPIRRGSLSGGWRVAGAWRVSSDDPRFGGVSALAVDGDELVALTDFGSVIRFAKPGSGEVRARIAEVSPGPRTTWLKANWDIEAVARDPLGRGWWASFEHPGELWLYQPGFRRALERIRLGRFARSGNRGIEGVTSDGGDLLLFAESGGTVVRIRGARARIERIAGEPPRISDVAELGRGRWLAIERRLSWRGFRNRLVELERAPGGFRRVGSFAIPAGPLDNFEGLAVERSNGRVRLWLVSDDSFEKPFRTVLLALDRPAAP